MKKEDCKEQPLQDLAIANLRIVELENRLKQVENELQQERDLVDSLLDTTDSLIRNFVGAVLDIPSALVVVLNPEGRVVNCNPAFINTTLYSLSEIQGKYLWEIFNLAEHLEEPQKALEQINMCSSGNINEGEFKTKNGKLRYVSWCYTNILNPDGSIAYILGTGVDITEKKLDEVETIKSLQKEKELNELKTSLISIASHEFRTPLSGILLTVELLQKFSKNWSESKRSEAFNRMKERIKFLNGLIENVLVVSKAESNFQDFNPQCLNLLQLCNEIIEEVQSTSSKHQIIFTLKSQKNPETCGIDKTLLHHILTNLLSNAIKYSPEASTVSFEVEEQSEQIIFKITDTGIGRVWSKVVGSAIA